MRLAYQRPQAAARRITNNPLFARHYSRAKSYANVGPRSYCRLQIEGGRQILFVHCTNREGEG